MKFVWHGYLLKKFLVSTCRRQRCFVQNVFRHFLGRDSSSQSFRWEYLFGDFLVQIFSGFFFVAISLQFFLKMLSSYFGGEKIRFKHIQIQTFRFRFRHLNLNFSDRFRFRCKCISFINVSESEFFRQIQIQIQMSESEFFRQIQIQIQTGQKNLKRKYFPKNN